MTTLAARPPLARSTASDSSWWRGLVALVFFSVLWLEVIHQLKPEWSLNPEYGYGWSVPFLCLYLLWRRWQTRRAPVALVSDFWPIVATVLFVLALFPIRFIAIANPDWRLLGWAIALVAVGISMLWIFAAGGVAWVRHFGFPVLFFLVAVPWPVRLEQLVIQDLMRAVTGINVLFLNLLGVPALRHGNVIEVLSGMIGIEEACSGVRSLQATLMISLFLGELYLFKLAGRILLVAAGALLAFICNIGRTAILVTIGANRGASGIEKWHDPAGLTILLLCLFGLWFISLIMRRHARWSVSAAPATTQPSSPIPFSVVIAVSLLISLIAVELGVQAWYRFHVTPVIVSRWDVQWPVSENNYKKVTIPPEAETLLHFNQGGGATWQTSDRSQWTMYFFQWLPGQTAARFLKIHRPDICLPATGMTMKRDSGLRLLSINGIDLPIRSYRFDDRGTPLHVFYCYWDARSSYENAVAAQAEDWSVRGRLRAALRGQRDIGAQMLELVVSGYQEDKAAEKALYHGLEQIVRVK